MLRRCWGRSATGALTKGGRWASATASDADLPANTLTFSLVGAPSGATIDPATGMFSWTTDESHGPGSFTFDVVVTDGGGLPDSETITVSVNEVNVAPVLGAIGDRSVDESTSFSFTATASDSDLPVNSLTFSLMARRRARRSTRRQACFPGRPMSRTGREASHLTLW